MENVSNTQPAEPVLEAREIGKYFGDRQVLKGINLGIEAGKTTVILGASGSGKSTLLGHLIGQHQPDQGEILYRGMPLAGMSEDELDGYRRDFGMLFQNGALFASMSVLENVALPIREHPDNRLAEDTIRIMVKLKLEQVGLSGVEDLMPSQLSGGMRKRVGLARALALDPEILFCDEPRAGLDPIAGNMIDELIINLVRRLNITSVVVTHDLASAYNIGDKLALLHEGKIVVEAPPEKLRHSSDPYVQRFIHSTPDELRPTV